MTIDLERLDNVFLQMQRALQRAILRIVRNEAEAEELAQEAYLRARRALRDANPDNLEAFLWRIGRNLALDHLRRQKVRALFEQHNAADADLLSVADSHPSMEEVAIQQDWLRVFTEALMKLPPRARRVWILSRVEKLPYPEIASQLGVSANTVFNDMKMAMGTMLDIKARMDRQ